MASLWDKPTPKSQLSMTQNTNNFNKTWGPSVQQPVSYLNGSTAGQPVSYLNQQPQVSYLNQAVLGNNNWSSGGGGGGGGAAPTGSPNTGIPTPTYDPNAGRPTVDGAIEEAQRAFQPIFDELDRRIGGIPSMQQQGEQQIDLYGNDQMKEAEASKTKSLGALDQTKQAQVTTSSQSLRDLAQGTGQLLQSAGNIWGDSSAVPAVTGAIAKQEGKNRAAIMAQRDSALSQIQQKVADVENEWGLQKQKIGNWVANQKLEVAKQMRDLENSIRGQKAEMQGNMRMDALNWARNRIAAIDDQTRQYAQAIDTWKMQRQGALEDYQKQLQIAGQYAPAANYGWDMSKMSPSQAADLATATGQPLQYGPYVVNPTKKTTWQTDPFGRAYTIDENGQMVYAQGYQQPGA